MGINNKGIPRVLLVRFQQYQCYQFLVFISSLTLDKSTNSQTNVISVD